MRLSAFIFLTVLAAAAVGTAVWLRFVADTALYDTNFAVFERLTENDRAGIVHTARQLMSFQVALLVLTNGLWIIAGGWLLRRSRTRHNQPLQWTGPGG